MTVRPLRTFNQDARARYRWKQEVESQASADAWSDALGRALDELTATAPGFENSYAYARESDDLPGGPYRAKMFGPGRKHTHRIVFRVTAAAGGPVIELVALRHPGQGDLTPLDL